MKIKITDKDGKTREVEPMGFWWSLFWVLAGILLLVVLVFIFSAFVGLGFAMVNEWQLLFAKILR